MGRFVETAGQWAKVVVDDVRALGRPGYRNPLRTLFRAIRLVADVAFVPPSLLARGAVRVAAERVPAVARLRDSALVRFVAKHGQGLQLAGMVLAYAASVIVTGGGAAAVPAVLGLLGAGTLATAPGAFDESLAEIQGRELAQGGPEPGTVSLQGRSTAAPAATTPQLKGRPDMGGIDKS
jgi:hypothetical protein